MHLFCIHIIYIWVVIKVVGIKNNIKTCYLGYATLLTISNQLRSHFNMGYSTDKMLPVESTPSGQSNLVSVEYTCIQPSPWPIRAII